MIDVIDIRLTSDFLDRHPYYLGAYSNHLLRISRFNRFLIDPVDPIERIYALIYLIINHLSYG